VTLIDGQTYEEKNLASQAIDASDTGKPKSRVQARRLRRIRPDLAVEAIVGAVESLPQGRLRCDLVLSGLDSKVARMNLGQAIWRLGDVPWIDAGVEPENLLARVNAYLPGEDRPCYECGWSDRDYLTLEAEYPCGSFPDSSKPTNAPSGLGALAASLQIIAAQKYLTGQADRIPWGVQVMMDAAHHKHYVTFCRRNPRCRFDHQVWKIEPLALDPRRCTLGDAMRLHTDLQPGDEVCLRVEGKPFVKRLVCTNCGHTKHLIRLRDSLTPGEKKCALCRQSLLASGWDLTESLANHLPGRVLSRSLASFGLRNGEVFSVGNSTGERHFEITVTGRD
jgi:hypothetical protein